MMIKIKTGFFIISLFLFLIPSAYSMTKEELEELGSTAGGAMIGSAMGHYVGKYVVPSIGLNRIDDSEGNDFGIIGGIIKNAQKGHAKNEWADSVGKYGAPLGSIVGTAIGGFIGYTVGEAVPKSIKKVYNYHFEDVTSDNPSIKPRKLDYFLTAAPVCCVLASGIYLYKVWTK